MNIIPFVKTEETRVGNILMDAPVYHKDDLKIVTPSIIEAISNGFQLYGVPISDEWLVKLGFKKVRTFDDNTRYIIGVNPITKDWLLFLTWLDSKAFPFYKNGFHEIKYVHQVQNLYFCMSNGKELEMPI